MQWKLISMHGYRPESVVIGDSSTVVVSLFNATNRPSLATTVTTTCGEEDDMPDEADFNLDWPRHAAHQEDSHHQERPNSHSIRQSIDSGITTTSASSSVSANSLVYEQSSSRKDSTSSTRLQWSLKSLRTEFKLKNTEVHYRRYQLRLNHRLFTVLMILNIVVSVFDTVWIVIFKVGQSRFYLLFCCINIKFHASVCFEIRSIFKCIQFRSSISNVCLFSLWLFFIKKNDCSK